MSDIGYQAFLWWDTLRGDRASMARLRRCQSAVEASSILSAIRLARRLGVTVADSRDADKALELAILLAHVRENEAMEPMQKLGWTTFPGGAAADAGTGPVLSELRFQRLLKVTQADKLPAFRRLVHLMKGQANVKELAAAFWFWGDAVKKRWAFSYYNAAAQQPKNDIEGDAA